MKNDGTTVALQAQLDDVAEALGTERMQAADGYHGTAVRNLLSRLASQDEELGRLREEVLRLGTRSNLFEVREKQATEMCTWLTQENQRLRNVAALQKHIDSEIDDVLEQSEEDAVTVAQLESQLSSATKRVGELEAECGRMREVYEAAKCFYSIEIQLAFRSDLRRIHTEDKLRAAVNAAVAVEVAVDDPMRCAVCGWSLSRTANEGCVPGNCSSRPRPTIMYAPKRAAREAIDAHLTRSQGKEKP